MSKKSDESETWDCPHCGDTYFFKPRNRREYCSPCGTGLVLRQPGGPKTPFALSEEEDEHEKDFQRRFGDCRTFRIAGGVGVPTTAAELHALASAESISGHRGSSERDAVLVVLHDPQADLPGRDPAAPDPHPVRHADEDLRHASPAHPHQPARP